MITRSRPRTDLVRPRGADGEQRRHLPRKGDGVSLWHSDRGGVPDTEVSDIEVPDTEVSDDTKVSDTEVSVTEVPARKI